MYIGRGPLPSKSCKWRFFSESRHPLLNMHFFLVVAAAETHRIYRIIMRNILDLKPVYTSLICWYRENRLVSYIHWSTLASLNSKSFCPTNSSSFMQVCLDLQSKCIEGKRFKEDGIKHDDMVSFGTYKEPVITIYYSTCQHIFSGHGNTMRNLWVWFRTNCWAVRLRESKPKYDRNPILLK